MFCPIYAPVVSISQPSPTTTEMVWYSKCEHYQNCSEYGYPHTTGHLNNDNSSCYRACAGALLALCVR
jgi:hypothetical protein